MKRSGFLADVTLWAEHRGLSDTGAVRVAALIEAASAMCPHCRSYPLSDVFSVDGRDYHDVGTLEYEGGTLRMLTLPCRAGAIRRLIQEAGK